jgi:hypothetical protein
VNTNAEVSTWKVRSHAIAFWDRFHHHVEFRIRQWNNARRTPQLVVRSCGLFVHELVIECAAQSTSYLKCRFDLDESMVIFTPGPDLPRVTFQFQWIPDSDRLVHGGREFSMDPVIDTVLDWYAHAATSFGPRKARRQAAT